MGIIGKRLRRGMDGLIDGFPGEIGKLNTDGSYTVRVEDTLNEVYVRLGGDPLRTVTAINNSTAYKARLPVRLRYNSSGRYEVIKVDPLPALAFLGEATPSANVPPLIGDAINLILNGDQFKPGRVRPETGLDLQFRMEELPYPGGLLGGPDTITDVTSAVAAIGGGKKAWVVFSVDPVTNILSLTNGADADPTDELTWADAAAITTPAGEIPLYGYVFQDGDTVPNNRPIGPDQFFCVDLRPWITLPSSGSGITQLTGDVTAGPGSGSQAATLATVNSNVGSFTNASVTVNGKGLITAASSGATPAPIGATYIVQTADGTLTNEQAMGALATGLVKNTTTTGVQSIAAAGTDYLSPTGTENFSNKTSTNQFMIDGSSDQVQQRVQAHSTQTNLLATWENSSAAVQASISGLGAAVFNEQGNDADFRIEGDTDPNVFVVDASLDNAVIGSATGSSDSKLAVNSTTSGFRPPRMTTTERNAISPIGNGVIIFNTTTGMPNVYSGSWLEYVLLTTTQTLTNKTIDGSVNTISNLDGSVITTGLVGASHLTAMIGATHSAAGTGGAIGSNPAAGDDIKAWLGNATFANIAHHQFSNEQSVTQSGTTSEVSLLSGTGLGSATIAANRLRSGSVIRLHLEGIGSRTATATTAFRVKLGGSTLLTLAAVAIAWATNTRWTLDCDITCYTIGGTGTVIGGFTLAHFPTTATTVGYSASATATTTVDTTGTLAVDVTSQMNTATAGNTVTAQQATIEIIG